MAYTPINWQTGDTITADKLNRCDNGWGYESTQLFSETVTTVAEQMGNMAQLAYSGTDTPETMSVEFDGTDYECTRQDGGSECWWGAPSPADFSTYPFVVVYTGGSWLLGTQTADTHTVAASVVGVEVSADFDAAVKSIIVDVSSIPLLCVAGTTTRAEMVAAESAGRLMYFASGGYFIITGGVSNGIITFMPEQSGLVAEFDGNDLFSLIQY